MSIRRWIKRKKTVGAIIQARTGSTRLPGKIFRDIAGNPLLFHVVERLRACKKLDKIVIATTTQPDDVKVLQFAKEQGMLSFAGDENDVQKRFIDAATKHKIDVVVRICSDSPFIDPVMIDKLVEALIDERAQYAIPDPSIKSAQEGFEVITLRTLIRSRQMSEEKRHREHVTLYVRENPKNFQVLYLKPHKKLMGDYRLSVDNYADLEFARGVYNVLYSPGRIVDLHEMVTLLKTNPNIYAKNKHVRQKATDATSLRVAFLIPDSADLDKKEIFSSIQSYARALNEHYHCGIVVLTCMDFPLAPFEELGYKTKMISSDEESILCELAKGKCDYVVSCGSLGSKTIDRLTHKGYKIFPLIGRRAKMIKEIVTGMDNSRVGQSSYQWA